MRVSAKVDYAVRAGAELAAASGAGPVKGDTIAKAQGIPLKFLENILLDLKHAGLVQSQRGAEGGYWLAKEPAEISVADVIRAVEGPIANVRGERPEQVEYAGAAEALRRSGSPCAATCARCSRPSRWPMSRPASFQTTQADRGRPALGCRTEHGFSARTHVDDLPAVELELLRLLLR